MKMLFRLRTSGLEHDISDGVSCVSDLSGGGRHGRRSGYQPRQNVDYQYAKEVLRDQLSGLHRCISDQTIYLQKFNLDIQYGFETVCRCDHAVI